MIVSFCAFGATGALAQQADEDNTGIDWSVALRGSYISNSITGGRAALVIAPEGALKLGGATTRSQVSAGSELVVDTSGSARISDLHARAEGSMALDSFSNVSGFINGSLSQADPGSSGLPVNTLYAPLVIDGDAQGVATRTFGHIDVTGTLEGRRYIKGPTTLIDLSTISNADTSYWGAGATLRTGYKITPLLSAFVEGEISVQKFDAPSPSLLVYLDGRTYQLRAGLSYSQNSILSAEASIGRAWLDYFDGSLTDAPSWVYNGTVTFRPDETMSLVGSLDTTLGPSTSVAGDTDVGYALKGSASYLVNPWVTVRGSAGWDQTVTLGTMGVAWGYDFGLGLDYRSSRHVVWSADYTYGRDYAPPAPLADTHTATVSVRVQR